MKIAATSSCECDTNGNENEKGIENFILDIKRTRDKVKFVFERWTRRNQRKI